VAGLRIPGKQGAQTTVDGGQQLVEQVLHFFGPHLVGFPFNLGNVDGGHDGLLMMMRCNTA
jgi:hypothetical protein